jgi:hypothetical protein
MAVAQGHIIPCAGSKGSKQGARACMPPSSVYQVAPCTVPLVKLPLLLPCIVPWLNEYTRANQEGRGSSSVGHDRSRPCAQHKMAA